MSCAISRTGAAAPVDRAPGTPRGDQLVGAPLLPAPGPMSADGMGDALAQIYGCLERMNQAQAHVGQLDVQRGVDERRAAEVRYEAARAQAEKQREGVFDWISKDIGLVGMVGLCSFHYDLVVADVALHKLGVLKDLRVDVVDAAVVASGKWELMAADVAVRKLDVAPKPVDERLERLGVKQQAPGVSDHDVQPMAKTALVASLAVAATAGSIFTAGTTGALAVALIGLAISGSGMLVQKTECLDGVLGKGSSKWVGLGMEVFGAVAASMSGLAGGSSVGLLTNGRAAAAAITGGSALLHGADQAVTAVNRKATDDAEIDAEKALFQMRMMQQFIDLSVDGLKESRRSHERASDTLRGVMETHQQTQLMTATRV